MNKSSLTINFILFIVFSGIVLLVHENKHRVATGYWDHPKVLMIKYIVSHKSSNNGASDLIPSDLDPCLDLKVLSNTALSLFSFFIATALTGVVAYSFIRLSWYL